MCTRQSKSILNFKTRLWLCWCLRAAIRRSENNAYDTQSQI